MITPDRTTPASADEGCVLLVCPSPPPDPILIEAVEAAGYSCKPDTLETLLRYHSNDGNWAAIVVAALEDSRHGMNVAFRFCETVRRSDTSTAPVLLLIDPRNLHELEGRSWLFDDFCLWPTNERQTTAHETTTRLRRLHYRFSSKSVQHVLTHGSLTMNLETYQASIAGHPLDLTYMEYKLLRFLAARPEKVFTREVLLRQVWGYDYYGGSRTVDVHIRRLRAKLGEEHASLIQTIRSVGYSFGQPR